MTPSETSGLLVYACPCPQNRYYTLLRKKSVHDGLLWFKQNMLFFPKRLLLTGFSAQWVFLKHQLSFNHWVTYLTVKVSLNNPQSALTAVFIGAPFYSWSALGKKHFLKSTQRTDRRCIWKQTLHFHRCPQWRWVYMAFSQCRSKLTAASAS